MSIASRANMIGALTSAFRPAIRGAVLAGALALAGCAGGPGISLDDVSLQATPIAHEVIERLEREASPLFRAIVKSARTEPTRDVVPPKLAVTFENRVELGVNVDPKEIFSAAASLIARAEREIVIQTFAFEDGSDPARTLFAALRARAREHARRTPDAPPIVVHVLVDAMPTGLNGNLRTGALLDHLADTITELGIDARDMRFDLAAFEHDGRGSTHAKLIGVDRRTFLVTGANLGHANDYRDGEHDAAYLVEGEVGEALHATWAATRHRPETKTFRGTSPLFDTTIFAAPTTATLANPTPPTRPSPVAVFAKPPDDRLIGGDERYALNHALLGAFGASRGELDLQSPNLNARSVVRAIIAAVERGQTVKLVLSKHYEDRSEWVPGQGGVNGAVVEALYDTLADHGLAPADACDRLQVRWYSHDGVHAVEGNTAHASHVKLYAFRGDDGDLVVMVGSLNLDTQSWEHSGEVLVAIDDDVAARRWLEQVFDRDFSRGIVAEPCARRSSPHSPR